MMRFRNPSILYVSTGVGIALTTSSFTMMGEMSGMAGIGLILAGIVLGALICVVISASIGELASLYPSSPGIRTYIRAAFGDSVSLTITYLYFASMILVAGLECHVFSLVLQSVLGNVPAPALVLAVLALAILVNLAGIELPRKVQIGSTALLVLAMVGLGALGWLAPVPSQAPPGPPGPGSMGGLIPLASLAGMSIFFFMGFEWVTPLGRDPASYRRAIPLSMPIVILVVAAANGMFLLGMHGQLPSAILAGDMVPHVRYCRTLLGGYGTAVALSISFLASFSTFNAGLLGGSRFIYALAREGSLPAWCARIWMRNGAPVGAILLLSGLTAAGSMIILANRLEVIASLVAAAIMCFIYAALMLSLLRLRRERLTLKAGFVSIIPVRVQYAIVLFLPGFGLMTLLSRPSERLPSLGAALLCCVFAIALARWSHARRSGLKPKVPGGFARPAEPAKQATLETP